MSESFIKRRVGDAVRLISRWGYIAIQFRWSLLGGYVLYPDEARRLAVELVRHADRLDPPKVTG